ncbi:uncharacterized protein LOC119884285 isoform X1 [Micropterus salmoides]|uniref:uncharacterized protein LOC119884285 isoform X1 n=1 Tax=Micropterus salmoides TaxID=27706 RepID=UPI0018EAAEAC|nr:uncharacterized protein LOC119884285 isoform X1 [Micropterus salmoides]
MALALGRLAWLSALRNARSSLLTPSSGPGRTVTPCRTAVCTSSGAIPPKPKKVSADLKLGYEMRDRRDSEQLPPEGIGSRADPLRPNPDRSGPGALLVCRDSDQQELCGAAGGARHLRPRGR